MCSRVGDRGRLTLALAEPAYDYRELGADHFDRIDVNRIRRSLVRRLERLGHKVTLEPLAQTA
ncbi:MAG TPA: hypothetical protein VEW05_31210 [Candidatus Polarisedimenticolia bacterium]|nr:hypothetical protein [Candidatus Polarisedimenticolia bacterium]